jgi:hypothetical protein
MDLPRAVGLDVRAMFAERQLCLEAVRVSEKAEKRQVKHHNGSF